MLETSFRAERPGPGGLAADAPQGACAHYEPRAPGESPLFKVLQAHLLDFLAEARERSDGTGLPAFVEQELRDFIWCGSFARGFARFLPLPAPSDDEVARALSAIRRRVVRLVRRHGIELERPEDEVHPAGPLAAESALLAALSSASVAGRLATGPRAGARVRRLGNDPAGDAAAPTSAARPAAARHAQLGGFDLHANIFVPAGDTRRLERLQPHYD